MLKWGVERRLEFIEFRLFWEGGVNRSDIIGTFVEELMRAGLRFLSSAITP